MKPFVESTCKAGFYHLHMIRLIRQSLDESTALLLCNALVLSRLDYANSLLINADSCVLKKLARVLHLAARTVKCCSRNSHISPILQELYWCPMESRPLLKVARLVYDSLCDKAPEYLSADLKVHVPSRPLRSSGAEVLTLTLGTAQRKIGKSAFAVAGPWVWNGLPAELRTLRGSNVNSFKDGVLKWILCSDNP